MKYIPLTENDKKEILAELGKKNTADRYKNIPSELILGKPLDIPNAMSEDELHEYFNALASKNTSTKDTLSFLGAGSYDHSIPSIVNHLSGRSEFYTSYTPYQPEISQGTLQALFEFQSMIAGLFSMDVANASMYDGAMAAAEAVLMAHRISKKTTVLLSEGIHPHVRETIKTYTRGLLELDTLPIHKDKGITDHTTLTKKLNDSVACVVVQYPNFFGSIEELEEIRKLTPHTLLVTVTLEPTSLGLLKGPGECGVDIACGEGMSLGIPLQFGGPYVGLFTAKEEYVRQMPGRLIGLTKDADSNRSFCITLSTREQHIRREKATSNICTNQSLCALRVAIYLATLGKQGLREVAQQNYDNAHYAYDRLTAIKGITTLFHNNAHFFNEFGIAIRKEKNELFSLLKQKRIFPGFICPELSTKDSTSLIVNVTEKHSKEKIDYLIETMKKVME